MKQCTWCGVSQPNDEFYAGHAECKECSRRDARERQRIRRANGTPLVDRTYARARDRLIREYREEFEEILAEERENEGL